MIVDHLSVIFVWFLEMGFGQADESALIKVKNWQVNSNSNSSKKVKHKKNKSRGGDEEDEEVGCWVKFRLLESCMPSRSKVDSSMSTGTSTNYGNFCVVFALIICI